MTNSNSFLVALCVILCCLSTQVGCYVVDTYSSKSVDEQQQWTEDKHNLQSAVVHHRRDASSIVFPPGTPEAGDCSAPDRCVLLTVCTPAQKNPSRFKICKWDGVMPLVCCPVDGVTATTETTTISSSSRTENTSSLPVRFKDPVPVDECAKQSLDLDTRMRFVRSLRPKPQLDFAVVPSFKLGLEQSQVFHPLVVGGKTVASVEKFPFMVGIYIKMKPRNVFLCGGSLITKNVVLTAAHCFVSMLDTRTGIKSEDDVYVIRLSALTLNSPGAVAGKTEFETRTVLVHPDFSMPALYNDIALLKFDGGVDKFSDTLRPVCLAPPSVDGKNDGIRSSTVIGWGAKLSGGSLTTDLQEAGLTVVTNSECNKTYAGLPGSDQSFPRGITSQFMCAGNVGKPKDACQGDSGGPLVEVDADLTIRQIGIVSSGFDCGTPGIPGIYTRVSHYSSWISENIG